MSSHAARTLPFDDVTLSLTESLRTFEWQGGRSVVGHLDVVTDEGRTLRIETFTNEFWTAKQRAAHSLHEISYRACFKPQLPRFFIERLTQAGDVVYDPFMGRGTTLVEAALMGRGAYGCDVNPLSRVLCEPRLTRPSLSEVEHALTDVDFGAHNGSVPEELLVFYHPETLRQICALRSHLLMKESADALTRADGWVRMIAVNRLTGHSGGFFSVYTLPPNQAVSAQSQAKINARLKQTPPQRDVKSIILEKSRSLLRDCAPDVPGGDEKVLHHRIVLGNASATPQLQSESVALVVTSPPFLDVVDYKIDNWLRCWFCGVDAASVPVTMAKDLDAWKQFVTCVLAELRRVLHWGGYVAFEVGEVRRGAIRLEETVVPAGVAAGLEAVLVLVNAQQFTKTANCWGVGNNQQGTNTNRVVVFRRTH